MTKESDMHGYVLAAGDGVANFDADVKASRASTNGALTFIESRTKGGAPRHVHTREDEFFYVVEGMISVQIGEDRFDAGPRSFVFLPRNIPHAWDVMGAEATVVIITVPAMLEEFLRDLHAASSPDARDQTARRYGIEFLK